MSQFCLSQQYAYYVHKLNGMDRFQITLLGNWLITKCVGYERDFIEKRRPNNFYRV